MSPDELSSEAIGVIGIAGRFPGAASVGNSAESKNEYFCRIQVDDSGIGHPWKGTAYVRQHLGTIRV